MDTFVTETLTAWQLENLIDTFKDQEVDEESFRLLDAVAIASLIPKIGHRVKFQKYHKELTAIATNAPSFAEGSPSSADTSMEESVEESTSSNLLTETLNLQPSFAIRQILQGTTQGKEIVQSLEEKRFISKQRKQLVRLLVSHLLETNGETPSTDTKKALAAALMYEFPCLLDGTGSGYGAWYTPGRNHKPATGFLEERLRNVRKRMRMLKRPRHQEQQEEQTPSTPDQALKVLPTLLPPSVYKIGGKVHRPTIEESRKSFINIQPVGTNMVQYLQTAERTQPFPHILCLGDDMTTCQTFTIVSDNAIETDTLLDCVSSFSILVSNSVTNAPNKTYSTCVVYRGILLGGMRRLQETNKGFRFTYTEDPNYGPYLQSVNGLKGSTKDRTYWELLVKKANETIRLNVGIGCFIPSENDQIILNFKEY